MALIHNQTKEVFHNRSLNLVNKSRYFTSIILKLDINHDHAILKAYKLILWYSKHIHLKEEFTNDKIIHSRYLCHTYSYL